MAASVEGHIRRELAAGVVQTLIEVTSATGTYRDPFVARFELKACPDRGVVRATASLDLFVNDPVKHRRSFVYRHEPTLAGTPDAAQERAKREVAVML